MLRGRIAAVNGVSPSELEIPGDVQWVFRGDRGLTWMREPRAVDKITAGERWPPDYDGAPLVSLHDEIGRALGLGPGDKLTITTLGREDRKSAVWGKSVSVSVDLGGRRIIKKKKKKTK